MSSVPDSPPPPANVASLLSAEYADDFVFWFRREENDPAPMRDAPVPSEFRELTDAVTVLRLAMRSLGRLAQRGDYLATRNLCEEVMEGIKILKGCPSTPDLQRVSVAWPSIVPAGPHTAPLWRAWLKDPERSRVGEGADVIRKSGIRLEAGQPAWLAMIALQHVFPLWSEGPLPDDVIQDEFSKMARNLPLLTKESVPQWRGIALLVLEQIEPDWEKWRGLLDREETAKTMSKRIKGQMEEPANKIDIPAGTARSTVVEALRDGLVALAGSFSKSV